MWLPSRRVLPGRLALLLVAAAVTAGALTGYSGTTGRCDIHHVTFAGIFLQNLGLCVVLASGVFTLGLSAVCPGAVTLFLTGVTMGAALRAVGGQAVALMAPHGLLEGAAWALAMDIGLSPVSSCLSRWWLGRARLSRRLPGRARLGRPPAITPVALARKAATVIVLLTIAATIEVLWTNLYAPMVHC